MQHQAALANLAMLQVSMTVVHQGRSAHPHDPVRALQGNLQLRLLLRDGFVQVSGCPAPGRTQTPRRWHHHVVLFFSATSS